MKKINKFPRSQRQTVSFMHEDGTQLWNGMTADGCKDEAVYKLTRQIEPEYANLTGIMPGVVTSSLKVNLERPGFIMYMSPKNLERNAEKFLRIIHSIEEILGVEQSEVQLVETPEKWKAIPFIAIADPFWIKSSVAAHFYFTLMRLAPYMKMREKLSKFLDRIVERRVAKKDGEDTIKAVKEAGYIHAAQNSGVLAGFMERELPCLNREGLSDWLLSTRGRGIATYSIKSDSVYPTDRESLYQMRVTNLAEQKRREMGYEWE